MSDRVQFPLDPQAVQAANKQLWRNHPELAGRPLTAGPEDAALRQEWTSHYRKAKANQPASSPVKKKETVAECPAPSCGELWKAVDKEVAPILKTSDPMARNRKISAAYANMYQRKPDYEWVGLGAVVSKQAGCAMAEAKEASDNWIGGSEAGAAYEGLGEANKQIFADIYPVMRFAELNGAKKLRECSGAGGRPVPKQLLEAVEEIEKGTPQSRRAAADMIANYEQRTVVQDKVYSNQKYKDAFAANENAYKWFYGRPFGAKQAALPLSGECGKEDPLPMDGSILNPNDRVKYYGKLMDEFAKKDQTWKNRTMNQIKK